MYKVYKLIKDNTPIYIGITNKKYLCDRIAQHKWLGKNFDSYELIEETNNTSREEYWIEYYDTFNNGLNKTKDGTNLKLPKQIRVWNRTFDKTYKSLSEACKELNLHLGNLSYVANDKQESTKGYKAKYL